MSAVLVIAQRDRLYLFPEGGGRPVLFRGTPTAEMPVRPGAEPGPQGLPVGLVEELSRVPGPVAAGGPVLVRALAERLGRSVSPASTADWRRARALLPLGDADAERSYLRDLAQFEVERALRAPGEILLTMAREEERLERTVGRERRASEALLVVPDSPLFGYARRWAETRASLERHHAALIAELEAAARALVPNLSSVVGPRIAARLVAAAGGLDAAGRMRASRLQLLGSRRRPSAERGPRYGILYRADRMDEVPAPRRGAYARSLAALASIALRADTTTRANLAAGLVRRRDRRIAQLQGSRR